MIFALSLLSCNDVGNKEPVHLNIKASGEVEVVPDIASITADVSCTNKDLAKSNDCASRSINELFALLNEHKILKEDYHSSRINLEKEYIWRKNSQIFHGYKSSSSIDILFKDLDVMSKVLTKAMLMKNIEISNLNYSHSDIDKLTNNAYLKALDNSKVLANEIKNKLDGKSIEIVEISNAGNINSIYKYENKLEKGMLDSFSSREASSIQINPGSLKLIKDIYVLYRVKH